MSKYRIVANGHYFKIQKKEFLFWYNLDNEGYHGEWAGNIKYYETKQEAEKQLKIFCDLDIARSKYKGYYEVIKEIECKYKK